MSEIEYRQKYQDKENLTMNNLIHREYGDEPWRNTGNTLVNIMAFLFLVIIGLAIFSAITGIK